MDSLAQLLIEFHHVEGVVVGCHLVENLLRHLVVDTARHDDVAPNLFPPSVGDDLSVDALHPYLADAAVVDGVDDVGVFRAPYGVAAPYVVRLQISLVELLQCHLVGLVDDESVVLIFRVINGGIGVFAHALLFGAAYEGCRLPLGGERPWPPVCEELADDGVANECSSHHQQSLHHAQDVFRTEREFPWDEHLVFVALPFHLVALHLAVLQLVEETLVGADVEVCLDGTSVTEVEGHHGEVVLRFWCEDIFSLFHDARSELYLRVLEVVSGELYRPGVVETVFIHLDEVVAVGVGHHLLAVVSHGATAERPPVEVYDEAQFVIELDGALIDAYAVGGTVEIAVAGGFRHVALHVDGEWQHPFLSPQVDAYGLSLFHLAILIAVGCENLELAHDDGLYAAQRGRGGGLYAVGKEINRCGVVEELLVGIVEQ